MLKTSDGGIFRLPETLMAVRAFKVGDELTEKELAACEDELSEQRCVLCAQRMVGARAHSRSELVKKLEGRGFSSEIIEKTADTLERIGFLNDGDYAVSYAKSSAARGKSARAVEYELKNRGVDADTVQKTIENLPPPDDALDRLIRTRMRAKPLDTREERDKLCAFLARRGFSWEDIKSAVRRYTSGENE